MTEVIKQPSHGILLPYNSDGRERHQTDVCVRRETTRVESWRCKSPVSSSSTFRNPVVMLVRRARQLSKRFEKREEAKEEGEEAKETGTTEDVDRFSRRTVKVTREHNEECRKLLGLMGIPFVVVSLVIMLKCLGH